MYVTHEEYTKLGYIAVGETEFARYEAQAEAIVRRFTLDRITDESIRPGGDAGAEEKRIATMNQHGVCQIIDIRWNAAHVPLGDEGTPITSFSNEGYSESYGSAGERQKHYDSLTATCINSFFTAEQRYRGV